MRRKVRQVPESFAFDLLAFAIAATEEMGSVNLVFVLTCCGNYMHSTISFCHRRIIPNGAANVNSISAYLYDRKNGGLRRICEYFTEDFGLRIAWQAGELQAKVTT